MPYFNLKLTYFITKFEYLLNFILLKIKEKKVGYADFNFYLIISNWLWLCDLSVEEITWPYLIKKKEKK